LRGLSGPEQLARNAQQQHTLSEAYLAGTPIVGSNKRDHDQIKTMTVIGFAFFSDEAFWTQPNTRKPRLLRIKVGRRSHRVMMRGSLDDPKRLEREIAKKLCVVFAARVSAEAGLDVEVGDTSSCTAGTGKP
jgi:hypothetical protein